MYSNYLSKIVKIYICFGIVLYAFLIVYWDNTFNYYNMLNVITFLSYSFLLWTSVNHSEEYYTNMRLGVVVFFYSLFFVGMYQYMCDYYKDNTFLFSEADARLYEKMCFKLRELPVDEWLSYLISHKWRFDDWGAPVFMTLILKILPSKLFLNFCYILLNTFSAIMLYYIGKNIMAIRYAYISALSYAVASYMIFFMGCFLKEQILVFLIIASMCMLYKYRFTSKSIYLLIGVTISLFVVLFRVPVALFVWGAYASLLILGNNGKIKALFFLLVGCVALIFAYSAIQYSSDMYIKGGAVTETYEYIHFSGFQKNVLYLGAIIGPFPQMFQLSTFFSEKSIFSTGLLFKLLLVIFFWKGFLYCLKTKSSAVYPIYSIVILEIVGLCLVLDGLETRKALPHIPFFIIAAFWYINKCDENTEDETINKSNSIRMNRQFSIWCMIVFLIVIVWNTLRIQ